MKCYHFPLRVSFFSFLFPTNLRYRHAHQSPGRRWIVSQPKVDNDSSTEVYVTHRFVCYTDLCVNQSMWIDWRTNWLDIEIDQSISFKARKKKGFGKKKEYEGKGWGRNKEKKQKKKKRPFTIKVYKEITCKVRKCCFQFIRVGKVIKALYGWENRV